MSNALSLYLVAAAEGEIFKEPNNIGKAYAEWYSKEKLYGYTAPKYKPS